MPEAALCPLEVYRDYIYAIPQNFLSVRHSTLVFYTISPRLATVKGDLYFERGIILCVVEQVDVVVGQLMRYAYHVSCSGEELYWYDPQPHPDDPRLAATYPHHKHIPPDIKHHRLPAPGLSFTQPNLPFLVAEIERDLLGL